MTSNEKDVHGNYDFRVHLFCSNALFMYFLDYQKSEYSTIREDI